MGNHGQSAASDPSRLIERFKKLVDPEFGNPCEEVLTTKTKKRRKEKKYECYRDQKANRGNVGNHCRALSRGHAQVEGSGGSFRPGREVIT
jgi:hypothetical protein